MPKKFLKIVLGAFLLVQSAAWAGTVPLKEWNDLTDTDFGPKGKIALSIGADSWKHAETAHFVYHFKNPKEAETVYIYSEHYYDWIKNFFGVKEDKWKKKGQVFVFEDETEWKEFLKRTNPVAFEAGGFTDGWELYMRRNPYWLAPQAVLSHELTHIVAFRFLDGPIPLFLNEGFADFVSYRAISTQFGGDEYQVHAVKLVKKNEYIALDEFSNMRTYPSTEAKTTIFYRQSELFVRFLVQQYGNQKFYSFLRQISKGDTLKKATQNVYGLDLKTLEENFKSFAIEKN